MTSVECNSSVETFTTTLNDTTLPVLNFEPGLSSVLMHPGISVASAQATGAALAENTRKHHCFFNDMRFHNHISHHLLALYSLGASPSIIKAAFERLAPEQRPALKPMEKILDATNWTVHLGDDKYYPNYLSFFSHEVARLGPVKAIEQYVFRNVKGNMLNRSLGGVYHPMIHWCYGLEFGNTAIVAEGLAIAAVHESELFSLQFNELINNAINGLDAIRGDSLTANPSFQDTVQNLRANEVSGQARIPTIGLSVFEIFCGISKDAALAPPDKLPDNALLALTLVCETKSNELLHWTDQWAFHADLEWSEIVSKTEELLWLVVAIYSSSYHPGPDPYKLDFYMMHCVTSFIFLPTILRRLDKRSQKVLLIAFFRSVCALWIARGRPPLHLIEELGAKELNMESENGRGWESILTSAVHHPDEHTTKIIRTFIWASQLFGRASQGVYNSKLPGSAELDGSIFYQAAVKTLEKQGWQRDPGLKSRAFTWY